MIPQQDLLARLVVEFFQTEESASKHPRIEAERLGGSPPGRAMLALADHADRVLPQLELLAREDGFEKSSVGAFVGDAFSWARRLLADRTLDREKSYRGTLIGLYHGIDLVRLLADAARTAGRERLAAFCDSWLAERTPLFEVARGELSWFGAHPHLALEAAISSLGDESGASRKARASTRGGRDGAVSGVRKRTGR
jgi:hypothetical protein